MNMRSTLLLLLCLMLVACRAPLPSPPPTLELDSVPSQTLRIAYPETLGPLATALASAYQREVPTVQVILVERADTLAVRALENGAVDIALLTWLPFELPPDAWQQPLASDGLAIVVNPQNGIPGLTLDQLRRLFQGQQDEWDEWGGLPGAPQIVSREEAAGDFAFFQAWVMGDTRVTLTAYLAPNTEAVLGVVDGDQMAVGYVSTTRLDNRVRALAIEGVPPAPEMVQAGHYPLSREIVVMTLGEPQEAARSFTQWVLGSDGQNWVTRLGFLPVQP